MTGEDPAGQPPSGYLHSGHEVEAQEGKVGQVILRKVFAFQMGVDASQPPQPPSPPTVPAEVGDEDLLVVPHDGEVDLALAIDDDPDLTSDLMGELGEVPGQFRGDDLLRWNLATIDTLQGLYLACPQAVGITVYLFNRFPLNGRVS
jgi:hypothetical protein